MPKSSVKSHHHHHHHHHHPNSHHQQQNRNGNHISSHINGLDNSHQCDNSNNGNNINNTPHLQHKDAAKRLKRKLRLQEMRCNLMSTKMTELKTALSTKKRQLRVSEKRAKDEEKKRRDEEKKLKDMEKEFHRLRKENDQIKENLARNQNINQKTTSSIATATTPTLTQQQRQPQASTSNPTLNHNSSSLQLFTPLPNTSSIPNSSNKNKNNKQSKRMAALISDDSTQVRSNSLMVALPEPLITSSNNNGNLKKPETATSSKPSSTKDLRINEGASCSGVKITSTDSTKVSISTNKDDENHFLGTSKLEDLFENELMCPICHELYIKPVALSCSHIFCSFCIEQWRKKAHRCPICRNMILERSPQNVLENVIDKVVSTMDEDSKKRRSDVIKDRPAPSESNSFSRNGGHRRHERLLMTLQNNWRDLAGYDDRSDSHSDSESYMPYPPAYGPFRSDSDLDSSDIDHQHMLSTLFERDPYGYYDIDGDYSDDELVSPSEDEEDDTEDVEYTSDESVTYEFNDDEGESNYDFDHDSSESSWEYNDDWQSSGRNSPITIDDSDSVSESSDYHGRNFSFAGSSVIFSDDDLDHDDQEEDDDEEGEEEEEEDDDDEQEGEEDEEEEEEHGHSEIEEEEEEDEDDEDEDEEEDEEEEEEEEEEDEDFYGEEDEEIVSATDSENSSPWEMEMTESDSDL